MHRHYNLADISKLNLLPDVKAKVIPCYERYVVTSDGKIYSFAKNKNGKLTTSAAAHPTIELVDENNVSNNILVSRLVAMAFLGCPKEINMVYVNHKDGDTRNNHVNNLEWIHMSSLEHKTRLSKQSSGKYKNVLRRWDIEYLKEIANLIREGYSNVEITRKLGLNEDERIVSKVRHRQIAPELIWTKEELEQDFIQSNTRQGVGANQSEFTLEEQLKIWEDIQKHDNEYVAKKYNIDKYRVQGIRTKKYWLEMQKYLENKDKLPEPVEEPKISKELIKEFISWKIVMENSKMNIPNYQEKKKKALEARKRAKEYYKQKAENTFEQNLNVLKNDLNNYSRYIIMNNGSIYNKEKGKYVNILEGLNCKVVSLYNDILKKNTTMAYHRVLMLKFKPPKDLTMVINHKDGDSSNNKFNNLEWVTQAENMTHGFLFCSGKEFVPSQREMEDVIIDILQGYSDSDIALKYCYHPGYVYLIRSKQRNKEVWDRIKIPKNLKLLDQEDIQEDFIYAVRYAYRAKEINDDKNIAGYIKDMTEDVIPKPYYIFRALFLEKNPEKYLTEREIRIIKSITNRQMIHEDMLSIEYDNNKIDLTKEQQEFYNKIHNEYPDTIFRYSISSNKEEWKKKILEEYYHTELITVVKTNKLYRTKKELLTEKETQFEKHILNL